MKIKKKNQLFYNQYCSIQLDNLIKLINNEEIHFFNKTKSKIDLYKEIDKKFGDKNADLIESLIDELENIKTDIYTNHSNLINLISNYVSIIFAIIVASKISNGDLYDTIWILVLCVIIYILISVSINKQLKQSQIFKYHFLKGYLYYRKNLLLEKNKINK